MYQGGKTGAQNIVKEIKQYQEKWLQHVQRMDTNRIPKQALHYKPKGRKETQDDRGKGGGTNFILRIKEQEKHIILHEHDDDDDDDDDDDEESKNLLFCISPLSSMSL